MIGQDWDEILKEETEKERATPEKVLALAVRNEERRQQCKDSRKDGAKSV